MQAKEVELCCRSLFVRLPVIIPVIFALSMAVPSISPLAYAKKSKRVKVSDLFFSEGELLFVDHKEKQGLISFSSEPELKVGDRMVVVRIGEAVNDPDTGALIKVKQLVIGDIKVISIEENSIGVRLGSGARRMLQGDKIRRFTSAPGNVEARSIGFRRNEITWNFQPEPESRGFIIYRSESGEKDDFDEIGRVKMRDAIRFVDRHTPKRPMSDATDYYYKVSTYNKLGAGSPKSKVVKTSSATPPQPPDGIEAEPGLIRSVKIKWDLHDNDEVRGYKVYRSESKKDDYELVRVIKNHKKVEYTDRNGGRKSDPKLADSKNYYYKVSAYSPFGAEGPMSKPVMAKTAGPPAAVTRFLGKGWQANKVPLLWDMHPNEDVSGYIIYRAGEENGPYEKIAEIKDREKTEYVDGASGILNKNGKKLENAFVYYYKIQAYNWVGSMSPMSEAISAMTKAVPAIPEDVSATSGRPNQIPIHWRLNPDVSVKSYQIFWSDSEKGEFNKLTEVSADKNYYLDKQLDNGVTRYYKVRTVDKDKLQGEFSDIVEGTTKKAPEPVTDVEWKEEELDIVLTWKAPAKTDVEEYIIHKKGFFGWKTIGSTRENYFVLKDMDSGDSGNYTVSVVGIDNLESIHSEPINITIP